MSNQIIEPKLVKDPILQTNERLPFPIIAGASDVTYKTQRVSGGVSNSGFNFTFNTPSRGIFLSRSVLLQCKIRVVMERADGSDGDKLYQSGLEAPRQYALTSIMDTINATINNQSMTDKVSDNIHALAKYTGEYNFDHTKNSMQPCMPDYYTDYDEGADSNKNPLAQYLESAYEVPRSAFPAEIIEDSNTKFEAVYTMTCFLPLSPFQFNKLDDHNGLLWISNMSVNINLVNNLFERFWSRAGGAKAIDSSSVQIEDASLLLKYLTPKETNLPKQVCYDYFSKNVFTTSVGQFTPGQERRITSQNIQMSSVPHRIFVFARKRNADQNVESTDTFHSIRGVSIQFDNQTGMLSSATTEDLYQISVKNGLKEVSYADWYGKTYQSVGAEAKSIGLQGSVLCLEPGSDLRLRNGVSVGMTGNFDFQLDITMKNNADVSVDTDLYVVVVYRGALVSREDGVLTANTGLITQEELKALRPEDRYHIKKFNNMYGGVLALSDRVDKLVDKHVGKAMKGGAKMGKKDLKERLMSL